MSLPIVHEAAALSDEVTALLPVLTSLGRQLREALQQVTVSADDICQRFQRIDANSRRAAAKTHHVLAGGDDTDSGTNVDRLCVIASETMRRLLQVIEQSAAQSVELAQRMEQIQQGLAQIHGFLRRMDAFAAGAKVLALNAHIEAVRVGQQGKAFAVVAHETSNLAQIAAETSSSIHGELAAVNRTVGETIAAFHAQAESDRLDMKRRSAEVEQALADVARINQTMYELVQEEAARNEELSEDVAQSIMALQFEDAVRQRVEHAVEMLIVMRQVLEARLAGDTAPRIDWAGKLADEYTMASQHRAHAQDFGGIDPAAEEKTDGNVTLF